MSLASYLSPSRTLMLRGETREAVLDELVEAACRDRRELERADVRAAVERRELELNTSIAPGIALPHARIDGLDGFILVFGLSPEGIPWGREAGAERVRIVALLIGAERSPEEHIGILGQLASLFRQPGALLELRQARSGEDLHARLVALIEGTPDADMEHERTQNRALLAQAAGLAEALSAGAVIVLGTRHVARQMAALHRRGDCPWILAAPAVERRADGEADPFEAVIDVPASGLAGGQGINVVVLIGLLQGIVRPGELIVCVHGREGSRLLDTVRVVDMQRQFGELLKLSAEIRHGDIHPGVLYRILQLANELAAEGREGHPIGTLFVVGDDAQVRGYCHQIVVNPFKGYADDERQILDPSLQETIKEFALLDGAFVVRGNGVVMSAGTCIQIGGIATEGVSGLGTRHAAGAAISRVTDALAVVLSQSTGTVSVYKSGRLILALSRNR